MNLCTWLALAGWFFIPSESLATRVIHDPGTVETSYDALNRPETLAEGGRLTTYGYDRAGRAVILVLGNGQVTENDHDLAGRLIHRTLYSSLENRTPSGILATFDWTYNALGNVMTQQESWPGALGGSGVKTTTLSYDDASRLTGETIQVPSTATTTTEYAYDDAKNRASKTVTGGSNAGHWDYQYNSANQLTAWEKREAPAGTVLREATLTYDDVGNRASQTLTGGSASTALAPAEAATGTTTYQWDAQDRLVAVNTPGGGEHHYAYDYRTRRIATQETPASGPAKNRAVVFSGGVSLAEYEGSTPVTVTPGLQAAVHYLRGPDMGGGVGGMLYSQRGSTLKYSLSNGRGDIVAQSNQSRAITWQASYEAYGRRTQETGVNEDRQRANSKEEDPTGLLNEGFRYRDLETGVWLSRDPAGFVDGPNLYAYVKQNPWTGWDPLGLADRMVDGVKMNNDKLHRIPVSSMEKAGIHGAVAKEIDTARANNKHPHGAAGHAYYNQLMDENLPSIVNQMKKEGLDPSRGQNLTQAEAKVRADELIDRAINKSNDGYIKWFDKATQTDTQGNIAKHAPVMEAQNRLAKGGTFHPSLMRRLRASSALGVKGANGFLAIASPVSDGVSFAKSLYFETPAGELDLMAAHLAVALLPPDKKPGFFGRANHHLMGSMSPYYSEERESTLRSLHSEFRSDLVRSAYGRGAHWDNGEIIRID